MADIPVPSSSSVAGDAHQPNSAAPCTALVPKSKPLLDPGIQGAEQSTSREPKPTTSGQSYVGCIAGHGVEQVLGVSFNIPGEYNKSIHKLELPGTFEYKDCRKEGAGPQVSGINLNIVGEPKHDISVPLINSQATGTRADSGNADASDQKINTIQHLGGRVTVLPRKEDK
ncbi:hypothetical protein FSARC_4301 [Fusarium sarcochroum]|uniref:Uncharacterized protein n=1 Tax=Fusarium sarcochroum TaxID=1208366 RepID=A0A8H4U1Y5_9HYPO|nr:hypothetical protein FSARC_4301 [Fusarium sarcochroum]